LLRVRVIPVLLLQNGGLVKTFRFKQPKYVGDPINAVKIFNMKEVDELAFLDIHASVHGTEPNYDLIGDISSEAFMPFSYGGGISNLEQIRKLTGIGVEKVILNTASFANPDLVSQAANLLGSSSIVVSIDYKRSLFGKSNIYTRAGREKVASDIVAQARRFESIGAGEILLQSIDRDGMQLGYDTHMIASVADSVEIPVIAMGGAAGLEDFRAAVDAGASAVGAGSVFVFHGRHKAVLITYPDYDELTRLFDQD
tara:strand:+ start:956 stop:1720 length:765 start_codon:yes stop_codon:yes gene_type:complete